MFTKEDSKSFLLYPEQINKARKKLNNEELGLLFGALLDYATDGTIYDDNPVVSAYFDLITHTLDIDNRKYKKRVEYRRENGKKGGRPRKNAEEPTKDKPQATKSNHPYKEPTEYTKEIVEAFTKEKTFDKLDNKGQVLVEELLVNKFDIDIEDVEAVCEEAYKKIHRHLIETENIYSLTYPANGKREPDETTKEIHNHMEKKELSKGISREDIARDSNISDESAFYKSFAETYKGKTVVVDKIELDYDYNEDMFFLKGTKKTSGMMYNYIMEQLWKQQ